MFIVRQTADCALPPMIVPKSALARAISTKMNVASEDSNAKHSVAKQFGTAVGGVLSVNTALYSTYPLL